MKSHHRVLLLALLSATLIKLYLAVATEGSLDVPGFVNHLDHIRELGAGAYRVRGAFNNPFNHPPAMIHVIKLWGWLADSTGLPFRFWLRLPGIMADVGSFFVLARLLGKVWSDRKSFGVLLALAVCPTAILISGFWGNTDSLMIFLVVLSIYLAEARRLHWLAGIVFGLALCVKVMPLCFIPAIFFYLKGLRTRFQFFGAAVLTFALCSMPYLAQDPKAIWGNVFGYASTYGQWGWTRLAYLSFPNPPTYLHEPYDVQGSHYIFSQVLKYTTIALILLVSIWFNRRSARPSLFFQSGLITALVLFMAPGFGIQYLVWLVPFAPALGLRLTLLYYSATSVYVLNAFLCDLVCLPPLARLVVSLTCWVSTLVIVLAFRRRLNEEIDRTALKEQKV